MLDGKGYLIATRSEADAQQATLQRAATAPTGPLVPETPSWPESAGELADIPPCSPGAGRCFARRSQLFFYKGRYHLHYIYHNARGFVFGHVSSNDMVHWKWHPTVLAPRQRVTACSAAPAFSRRKASRP